jgi:hypothetical protein
MSLADELQIERDNQRRAPRSLGALDQRLDEAAVAHDVELEPEGLCCLTRYVLNRADAHGRERERHSCLLGCARGEDFAVGPLHAEDADRRQCHRHRGWFANDPGLERPPTEPLAHALPELDRRKIDVVLPVGRLAERTRVDIVKEHAGDPPPRQSHQIVDFEDLHDPAPALRALTR